MMKILKILVSIVLISIILLLLTLICGHLVLRLGFLNKIKYTNDFNKEEVYVSEDAEGLSAKNGILNILLLGIDESDKENARKNRLNYGSIN